MTPQERAAMQQAIEFIVDCEYGKAELALREALAEPDMNLSCKSVQARLATSWGYVKAEQAEQEPVACIIHTKEGDYVDWNSKGYCFYVDETPLYAAPVRTKDLTDNEIWEIEDKLNRHLREFPIEFARAVIAADREKNK